jgi:hypothetical protein
VLEQREDDAGMGGVLEDIAREMRTPVSLSPDFNARVMAAVRAVGPHRPHHPAPLAWWHTLLTQRGAYLRPLSAFVAGAAAALVGVALVRGFDRRPSTPLVPAATPAVAPAESQSQIVRFVVVVPNAHRVAVLGDFNHWDPIATPLAPAGAGAGAVWVAAVRLTPGRHAYTFLVDGARWVADPTAPRSLDDDFGAPTSTVTVADGGAAIGHTERGGAS